MLIIVSSVKQLYSFISVFQKVTGPFLISAVISASAILKTLNGPVHLFFSQKIRTSLPKFRANGNVYIVSGPLRVLIASYTPRRAFNLHSSLVALAMALAHCCCKAEGGEFIIMQR